MLCFRAKKMLSAYIDNELGQKRRFGLESHLSNCHACSAELETLRRQWNALLESDPKPALPADLWAQVLTARDEFEGLPWYRRYRMRILQMAAVTAFVVAGFLGGAALSWKKDPSVRESNRGLLGEQMMVVEAFDVSAFGLREGKEGLFRCDPK